MAKGGDKEVRIAKAFIEVEARLKKETFDKARQDAQAQLKGGQQGGSSSGGMGRAPTTPRPPTGPAPAGVGAQAMPLPTDQDIKGRLARARSAFMAAGTDYGRALEGGFAAALGNLGNLASRRVQEAQRVAQARMANTQPPAGTGQAARPATTTGGTRGGGSAETPEAIAQRFTQRFSSSLMRSADAMRGRTSREGSSTRGGTGGSGTTVNNFHTRVEIDPRRIQELLNVVKTVNQLKARNRARPKEAPLLRPGRGAGLRRTEVVRDEKRIGKIQALRAQARGLAGRLRSAVQAPLGSRHRPRWNESRHTRFVANLADKVRELGPGGGFRKTGQFYFNTKFRGAFYENRTETRNRALRQQAWQQKETIRRQIAQLEGRPYRPTKRPKSGRAMYYRKSVQARGKGGRPGMYGYGQVQSSSSSRSRSRSPIRFRAPRRTRSYRGRGR